MTDTTTKYFNLGTDDFRLDSMPSAQCHIRISRDKYGIVDEIDLISYSTLVCVLKRDIGNVFNLWCTGTYSTTTSRHINRFTTEFCGNNYYYKCRDAIKADNLCRADFGYYVADIPCFGIENRAEWYTANGKPYFGHY